MLGSLAGLTDCDLNELPQDNDLASIEFAQQAARAETIKLFWHDVWRRGVQHSDTWQSNVRLNELTVVLSQFMYVLKIALKNVILLIAVY